ncbi:hypothetical protein WKI68_22680 [Streptomyces sp. MS1.HAVA.3]|uniref:Uncharacterized protein n=1 Tax=Streptomyces caledonius TaxID=3134107 RepID=A0ABU8U6D1_9ACTN
MIIEQAAERVVLVRPGPGLVSAAVVAGLDVWVVSDPGPWPRPQDARLPAGLPPQRLLRVDFDDAEALRALLADTVLKHGIGHILYLASDLEKGLGTGPRPLPRKSCGNSPRAGRSRRAGCPTR